MLYTRILTPHHDSRYAILNNTTLLKTAIKQCFFQSFFQMLLVFTFYPLTFNVALSSAFIIIGIILFSVGFVFESSADYQLYLFKKKQKGICQAGLWNYSRHPNYFFECLLWFGISVIFIPNKLFLLSFVGPLTIFLVMYFITGPLTERASLKKHGIDFQNYRKNTPYFVPFLKR